MAMMPAGGIAPQSGTTLAPGASDTVPEDMDELPNVSDEEQAQYERFVLEGFALLYDEGTVRPTILQMLDEDPADLKQALGESLDLEAPADPQNPEAGTVWDALGPVIALAATGAILTLQVLREYDESERPPGEIVFHGGKALLEELAEIASLKGGHDYSEDELAEAFRRGADLFREAAADEGLINLDEAKGEFDEIVTADREGRTEEILPGISALAPQEGEQVDGVRG